MRRIGAALALVGLTAGGCVSAGQSRPEVARTIEIFGPYRGVEADRFVATLRPFEKSTGIHLRYIGTADFVADLNRRVVKDNDPPDVAMVPQPGLVTQLADDKRIVPPGQATTKAVAANDVPEVARLAKVGGTLYSVPFRISVKSLVWYRPSVFTAHGWTPPKSLDQLNQLVNRIQSTTSVAPWCFGMAADSATGWAATDWVEDLVLRSAGLQRYQRWAEGTLPFSDPVIAQAFSTFRSMVLAPGRTAGGLQAVTQTPVDEAWRPLLAKDPGCAMYKQADFAASWMPTGTTIGPTGSVNWFVLPGVTTAAPPVVLGGDQAVQFHRGADVDALMTYLAGPEAGRSWAQQGGFLSPKTSIPISVYPRDYLGGLAPVLRDTTTIAFDASDQMPPEIGSSLLWSAITDWVSGVDDYATFAARIDSAFRAVRAPTA